MLAASPLTTGLAYGPQMTADPDPAPLISEERIRAALAALGLREIHSADPVRVVDRDILAGALLALADLSAGRADPDRLDEGYRWALGTITGGDAAASARWWARLAMDRLHLAADGLPRDAGSGLPLAEVAGPAALAAANVLMLLHHSAPDPGLVALAVSHAQTNLGRATEGLAQLRVRLAADGYDL